MIQVTIWNEHIHERKDPEIAKVYPQGIHQCIGSYLEQDNGVQVTYALMEMEDQGLPEEVLNHTDVLIWWGHWDHNSVKDELVDKICQRVLNGMGFIALHSSHHCKVLKKLLGTSLNLKWRHDDKERLVCIDPSHPIACGVAETIVLEQEEMYGEFFDIPKPDDVIYLGWFKGGEVFRSGCTFTRGMGKIFYFQPGHEQYPTYFHPEIRKIILNAVKWAAPTMMRSEPYECIEVKEPQE